MVRRPRLASTSHLREGSLAAFGYVLHLEFPEPGMHAFERLLDGPHAPLATLGPAVDDPPTLCACERQALLSKVSEIDRMRQFTTKYTLDDAVRQPPGPQGGDALMKLIRSRDQLGTQAEAGDADRDAICTSCWAHTSASTATSGWRFAEARSPVRQTAGHEL